MAEGKIMDRRIVDHGNYVGIPVNGGVSVPENTVLRKVFIVGEDEIPSGFVVEGGSTLEIVFVVLPGVSETVPLCIDITGEGANVLLSGISLSGDSESVRFNITMHHRAGHCVSRQVFNCIASGRSECSFSGKIIVAPSAQQTEAYQENHNILLSEEAKINTKPQLEIYADDVKCSHGATVGRLDEDAQFYMRSRGVPEDEAKVLQMISFIAPVLEYVPEKDRDGLALRVEEAVRSLAMSLS